ncbi:zinc finger SWIM domain-containing protein 7 isoform X1 [Lepisosteus oculatus]|uniref:zinc finger SWIM domain-containing protein 7 isoform X1 n=2 Tax=Lepisosteus oculatus TaxID=7918 RepID=UPI00073FB738|nr:PREDICTED: zinc finger SWIM domain-containing protein 7 isoform X2 [Lepisosteus oculatus]
MSCCRIVFCCESASRSGNMSTVLPDVAEEVLKDIRKAYQETSQIPDELLLVLKFVFGSSALYALDLVDHRAVTCVTSPSGRKVFQVVGSSGRLYTCYSSCHYCPCPSFTFSVLRRNNSLLCKHILAVYLCRAMGLCRDVTVTDQQMSAILCGRAEEEM